MKDKMMKLLRWTVFWLLIVWMIMLGALCILHSQIQETLPTIENNIEEARRGLEVTKSNRVIARGVIKDEGWERYLDSIEAPTDVKDWITRIVECESRGDPLAKNGSPVIVNGVSYGHASGLGQFLISTWNRGEGYLGRDMDIWNEYDQVDMMVEFYRRGQQHEWSCN